MILPHNVPFWEVFSGNDTTTGPTENKKEKKKSYQFQESVSINVRKKKSVRTQDAILDNTHILREV